MLAFPHFSFYDWLLIICVSSFGTVSSFVRDPQIKAVFATVPVPFSLAWLAVGLPVATTNSLGLFLVLLYVHVVRVAHDHWRVPIVLAIGFGILLYASTGAFFAHKLPNTECLFAFLCGSALMLGIWMLKIQNYHVGIFYRTPLHPLPKFGAMFIVVFCLALLKHQLLGFTPFFPMMNSITSYEARHSLAVQCRQIPVFLVAGAPMLGLMRFLATLSWTPGAVLAGGVVLYMVVFIPVNAWVRKQGQANVATTANDVK